MKNKLCTVLLSLVAVFMFSSCDDKDEEWRVANIDYPASVPVQPNGTIRYSFDIGSEWIDLTANTRYSYIDDFTYRRRGNGFIDIYGGPFIRSLTFRLENSDVALPITINNTEGAWLEDTNSNQRLQYFFNGIVESIWKNGYARIYVEGNADPRAIIDIDFYIELDAYVIY